MKRVYSPKEVLLCVVTDFVNAECDNPDSIVSAQFVGDDGAVQVDVLDKETEAELRSKLAEEEKKLLN